MTDTTQTTDTTGSADQTTTQSTQTDQGAADKGAGAGTGGKGGKGTTDGPQKQAETAAFYEGFTDASLKDSPVVLRHKTVEDMARSLVAAEKRLGVPADQLIRLPTKDEELADVYRKLGAPESAEGYDIGLPDKATDQDKALAGRFAKAMFDAGPYPPGAVKAAIDFINAETLAGQEAEATAAETRRAEGEAWLKKELGAAYDPEMKAVGKFLTDHGPEGLAEELDLSGHGDNPKLMRFVASMVEKFGESQGVHGQGAGTGQGGAITPGQAKAARINLENDPIKGVALRDAAHPMHKTVLEERARLLALEGA